MPEEQEFIEENPIPEAEQLLDEEPPEVVADFEPEEAPAADPDAPIEASWRNDQYAVGKAMGLEPE